MLYITLLFVNMFILSRTTSIVNTGDTFPMSLEIRIFNLTLNQANVSLSCSAVGCTTQVNLHIKGVIVFLANSFQSFYSFTTSF